MTTSALRESQLKMARFLRNPETESAPEGIEPRRLKIYQDLIYNNIEGFISSGFPVLRTLYSDDNWHQLVRLFIEGHSCRSPYFLEISQEFLDFLMQGYERRECDPPFIAELAHYEWVELALDVSEAQVDQAGLVAHADPISGVPVLSELAWLLSYQFPVQRIGPGFQPAEAVEPTYLVVYRDRADKVRFMELNGATARLLELVRDNERKSGAELLGQLASELQMPEESVQGFGRELLGQFVEQSIICGFRP
ncbi:MAG: putative DNA-binding domain-containing protein [Halioglobus sp.]